MSIIWRAALSILPLPHHPGIRYEDIFLCTWSSTLFNVLAFSWRHLSIAAFCFPLLIPQEWRLGWFVQLSLSQSEGTIICVLKQVGLKKQPSGFLLFSEKLLSGFHIKHEIVAAFFSKRGSSSSVAVFVLLHHCSKQVSSLYFLKFFYLSSSPFLLPSWIHRGLTSLLFLYSPIHRSFFLFHC